MSLENHNLSELINDFSFSWEFISAVGFVLLVGSLLALVQAPCKGSVGSDCVACSNSFLISVHRK